MQPNSTTLKNANESSDDVADVITMRSTINNQSKQKRKRGPIYSLAIL